MKQKGHRVNALIMGTQKGGTTALAQFLSEHHHICFSRLKELHFFDNDNLFSKYEHNKVYDIFSTYNSHFDHWLGEEVIMEATPIYMYWEKAYSRIQQYNPNMKMIFILRDPVARAFSQWKMEYERGDENLNFNEALIMEKSRLAAKTEKAIRHHSYIDRGFYYRQISSLSKYFPLNNFLIITTEDLKNKHQETLDLVCDFLKIPIFHHYPENNFIYPKIPKLNPLPEVKLTEQMKKRIAIIFENDIKNFRDHLKINFPYGRDQFF